MKIDKYGIAAVVVSVIGVVLFAKITQKTIDDAVDKAFEKRVSGVYYGADDDSEEE